MTEDLTYTVNDTDGDKMIVEINIHPKHFEFQNNAGDFVWHWFEIGSEAHKELIQTLKQLTNKLESLL